MPQIPKHLKIKRSQKNVLVKNRHFLKNFPVVKSCKLLCKQLRSNNNSLAKALSKEKQECQVLFSENVDLTAMVQDLGLACNKRDAVISKVLKNSKEMLQMIVTMSGYLTNTISFCQEFAKLTNTHTSYNSVERRDSVRRLSMKSPTRGVVKPMVSGHTITKPTINLSRLNMQNINNSSHLSIIPEVTTPPRNEDSNNSISIRPRRYTNGRKCRMPERLNITRNSDENERRLNERSRRHSGKLSGGLSKSRSSMNNSYRYSIETFENIGSPRVQLNDVSKLLQNSQTINIRMLEENQNNVDTNSGIDDTMNLDVSQSNNIISETPPSSDSPGKDDRDVSNQNQTCNNTLNEQGRKSTKENLPSNWEDPLEGPSWLFNNSQAVPFTSKEQKTDNVNDSNNSDISMTLNGVESDKESSDDEDTIKRVLPLPASINENSLDGIEKQNDEIDENDENTSPQSDNNNLPNMIGEMVEDNEIGSATGVDRVNFVTQRRGCLESEDEDDFTLILPTLRRRNMHFDMNDLKLPVLDQSALKPQPSVEPEPETTGRIPLQKISQIIPIPSVSHNSLNESAFNQSTVKLPTLVNNDYEDELTPTKEELGRKRKKQMNTESNYSNCIDTASRSKNKNKQKKKKNKIVKDPSSAKVVLEKLNESDVKSGTPTLNKLFSGDSNQSLNSTSLRATVLSDSDSNESSSSLHMPSRPKRVRAPITLHEPNLRKKLRRNE
ncbi:probable protein phosphatase DDB_G0279461 isoform X2 [Ceratina calcarata]|uniref:Probable protein phosphatase DDB_G0279461 isoform X2 n=1 Tax=Ceratina calcarata TaxID=156304 RepID=A0AAJ7N989_9HYME|nr:probable protein phosphatase DDB_G0279461 isoform X2 [Ceratina calcarata]